MIVHKQRVAALCVVGLAGSLAILFAGCGKKEEPVPQGGSYYTGPMAKKDTSSIAKPPGDTK